MSTPDHFAKNIVETPVEDEIATSFMAYAMSVITARAIPDARDGLKPVQRRILHGLNEQGIRPGTPYKKCARAVGDVMGRYHPHGDSAIYEALVRMAQDFSMRIALVDGHGNFGTHDDPPAASRYTECRMTVAAAEMVADIAEDTIDMRPNYDGSEIEPEVLPAKLPNLLVNGTSGIAVGMTTNIPSHNLAETVAAARMVLANRDTTLDDIMTVMPGPDFPTGGVIVDGGGVRDYFAKGRGSFKIRGKAEIDRVTAKRDGIVITELPYTIGAERLIGRIKKLIAAKQIDGIADIKDLTDRKRGLRIVVECRTGVSPQALLSELYAKTHLEESFTVAAVALVNGRPETLGVKQMLEVYLDHRLEVVVRRARFRLAKAEARAHIVEGLVAALANIDDVVTLLRRSKDTETARSRLMRSFKLSDIQASHILEMPLRRLVALEVNKLKDELRELRSTIADLKDVLARPERQAKIVDEELLEVAEKLGDRRRSRLVKLEEALGAATGPLEIVEEPTLIMLRPDGTVHAGPTRPAPRTPDDLVAMSLQATNKTRIGVVTSHGRVHELNAPVLPDSASVKVKIADLIPLERDEDPLAFVNLGETPDVLLVCADGTVKRMSGAMIKGKGPIEILPGRRALAAFAAADGSDVVLVSALGQLLRCDIGQFRAQGKAGGGVAGMRLGEGDEIIAAFPFRADRQLVTVTDQGAAKRTSLSEYPAKGRNTGGVRCHRLKRTEQRLRCASSLTPFTTKGKKVREVAVPDGKRDASGAEISDTISLWSEI